MKIIENSSYNREWQENRIRFILSLYDESFFKGKKILELGAFNGDIGNYFTKIGSVGGYITIKPVLKVCIVTIN